MTSDDARRTRRRRGFRPVMWILIGLTVMALHVMAAGRASAVLDHSPTDATAAEQTVRTLVGPHPESVQRVLPTDFAAVMGYRPVLESGYPANPDGGCSSPIPLPERFENACRTHDFGYDLLRYAQRTGRPLGPWARPALDHMLIERMHAACHDPVCSAAAELSRAGLALNTWRQYSGPPAPSESMTTIAASTAVRVIAEVGGHSGVAR
ncbi:hypothetical protein [Gordonia polyisoprenivorans]|nr:hypothetical protein [Gordonia polyisoprenivorans]MBE7193565.1 hypothetical protein [Gordonia polyisoprenivorans]NKY03694.1 hypothetical protein [Gordonia polyisoprenivorans]QUD84455.1 hypothetical protein J8M97_07625 [Gordonia polyisoprenivorans]WCB35689.1 hypothetical protein PHA63_16420 [Gordonia polyisoprenivorans]